MYIWIAVFSTTLIWSGINPKDTLTWLLEVAPAVIAAVILAYTYKSFRLTPLLYTLILIHSVILMVGGHYTYAEVPLFDYLAEIMESGRNNYDKVGHFAQGFIPAMVAREIIVRKAIINGSTWQSFFIIALCLGFSAFYELIEWWVALIRVRAQRPFSGHRVICGIRNPIWPWRSSELSLH